ncbi:MAG: hypothetical protein HY537_06295 [Deltaproteobacteria bacterium]|nr:hypothetical protein [Deltaproteobacteria bacterium]
MESAKGKLTNKETGNSLVFSINPSEFRLSKGFEFEVQPCLGQSAPLVSFKSGGAGTLTFQLVFDKDADSQCDLKKVTSFLKSLNTIKESTKSVPLVEFSMGSFTYLGYVAKYVADATRFNNQGDPTCVRLDVTLISNAEQEQNGK